MARVADWRFDFMRGHPRLFEVTPGMPEESFGYPLCGPGWRDVLERLCGRIEIACFTRIKQKFGPPQGLLGRRGEGRERAKIGGAINLAVARSACTCETCGAQGRRYVSRGWLATSCAEHAAGDPVPDRDGKEIHLLRRMPGTTDMYYARYDRETARLTEVAPPAPEREQ